MLLKINIYKIFFLILFLSSMFIGSIRVAIGPIRLDLIFELIILFYLIVFKKIYYKKTVQNLWIFLPFMIYFIFSCLFITKDISIKDILFIIMPIYAALCYYILSYLSFKINLKFLNSLLKVFILINFIFVIFQYFNLFNTNAYLSSYYTYLSINNSTVDMTKIIQQRASGLVGNPTFLTFLVYLIYKIKNIIKPEIKITILALLTMLFSGGRMVLLFTVIWEAFEYIHKNLTKFKNKKHLMHNICKVTLFIIGGLISIILIIRFVPFLYEQVWQPIENASLFSAESYTWRGQMYKMLASQEIPTFIFGGKSYLVLSKLQITAFDSEYVLRILQFGLLGLFFMYLPLIYFSVKNRFEIFSVFPLALCLTISITNFTITNYTFIFYIILYVILYNKYVTRSYIL